MDIFGIPDLDPHKNLCGSETLINSRIFWGILQAETNVCFCEIKIIFCKFCVLQKFLKQCFVGFPSVGSCSTWSFLFPKSDSGNSSSPRNLYVDVEDEVDRKKQLVNFLCLNAALWSGSTFCQLWLNSIGAGWAAPVLQH